MAQKVSVTLDAGGNVQVKPDPVYCQPGEQLTWTVPQNASLTIILKNPVHGPFVLNPPYQSKTPGDPVNVQVKPLATAAEYPYTAKLQVAGKSYEVDPTVIIDDNRAFKCDEDEGAKLVRAVSAKTEDLLQEVLNKVTKAAEGTKLFPQGIDYISIDVEVTPVKVMLVVSGPKSSGS